MLGEASWSLEDTPMQSLSDTNVSDIISPCSNLESFYDLPFELEYPQNSFEPSGYHEATSGWFNHTQDEPKLPDLNLPSSPTDESAANDYAFSEQSHHYDYICPKIIELSLPQPVSQFAGPETLGNSDGISCTVENHQLLGAEHEHERYSPEEAHKALARNLPLSSQYNSNEIPLEKRSNNRNISLPIRKWFFRNISAPYATKEQIQELASETGLPLRKVRICLSNLRARWKPQLVKNDCSPSFNDSPEQDTGNLTLKPFSTVSDIGHFDSHTFPQTFLPESVENRGGIGFSNNVPYDQSLNTRLNPLMTTRFEEAPQPPPARDYVMLKRKGKKRYASRYELEAANVDGPTAPSDSSNAALAASSIYHCTVCLRSFRKAYEWRRHESAVHGFHPTKWICMPNGPLPDGLRCAFCPEFLPEAEHDQEHNILKCLDKHLDERTFPRKDQLKQHILQVHLTDMDPSSKKQFKVPESWAQNIDANCSEPRSLWCGFCKASFESTARRMDHVAEHFRSGADMSNWEPLGSL